MGRLSHLITECCDKCIYYFREHYLKIGNTKLEYLCPPGEQMTKNWKILAFDVWKSFYYVLFRSKVAIFKKYFYFQELCQRFPPKSKLLQNVQNRLHLRLRMGKQTPSFGAMSRAGKTKNSNFFITAYEVRWDTVWQNY